MLCDYDFRKPVFLDFWYWKLEVHRTFTNHLKSLPDCYSNQMLLSSLHKQFHILPRFPVLSGLELFFHGPATQSWTHSPALYLTKCICGDSIAPEKNNLKISMFMLRLLQFYSFFYFSYLNIIPSKGKLF